MDNQIVFYSTGLYATVGGAEGVVYLMPIEEWQKWYPKEGISHIIPKGVLYDIDVRDIYPICMS